MERLIALLRMALKYKAERIHLKKRFYDVEIECRIDGLDYKVKGKLEDYKLFDLLQDLAQGNKIEIDVDGRHLNLRYRHIDRENYREGYLDFEEAI